MNIKGGALEFDIIANNGQINSALEETKKRVKGFTDATVEGGDKMEAAYKKAAETIEAAWKDIDTMTNTHQGAIAELEKEYAKLGEAAVHAFQKGTAKGDEEYRSLTQKQQVVQAEINQRKQLLQEIGTTADALLKEEQTLNTNKAKVEQNTQAKAMLRTQVMNLKNSLAEMEQAGKRDTDEFRAMQVELGRLQDAMADANTQAKIMSDDYRNLNTAVEVIGGVTGAFSAAQGAVGLFAGENENLQKIMVKVQSLMAITIGLQQVSKTLNKDSYTQLVLVRRAKELLIVAEAKFATALGISNVMAKALMATLTLGLSVAITAIVVVLDRFITKNREAKKAQEEFNKKVSDTAASSIANFNALSYAWGQLGNNLEAKQKFVEQNADKFKELGFTINTVKQAEDLLIANSSRFVEALMQRAKATATAELAVEQYKKVIEAQNTLDRTPKAYVSKKGTYTDGYGTKREGIIMVKDSKWQEAEDDLAKQQAAYEKLIAQQATFTAEEKKILASIGADSATITEGSINALEDQINKLQAKYKEAGNDQERAKYLKQIQATQKTLDKITAGSKKTPGGSSTSKNSDPYLTQLEERKKNYTEYYKWVNSKDDIVRKAAQTEFAGLLSEGSNYLDYLKKQREQLSQKIGDGSATKAQTEELHKLNNAIAEETKDTVLAEFEKELQNQLAGARSILEMLNILEERRKQLAGDGSDLDNRKKDIIDSEQENVANKAKEETDALLDQYNQYLEKRINKSIEFENQMALLRRRASMAETKEERDRIEGIVEMYEKLHELHIDSFEELDQINADSIYRLGTFEQKRLMIVQEYEKLIGAARLAGQEDVAKKLEGERDLEIMKETRQYQEFFGDISEVSIKTLENTRRVLLKMMQEAYNAGKLTADQYKKLIDEINKQADSAYKGRGFEALFGNTKVGGFMNMLFGEGDLESKLSSFKTMFSGAKTDMASIAGSSGEVAGNAGEAAGAMQGAAGGAAGALSIIDAIIKGVYQTLRAVSDTLNVIAEYQDSIGNSDAADNLGDWADTINVINETAMRGWENLKSGNVMGAISDTISLPFKLLTTLNKIHDKKIDKAITKHADAVKDLTNTYNALSHAIENALGETVYKSQKAAIESMRQDQVHLEEIWRKEESKKKTDNNKVKEYQEQYAELGRQIEDMIAEIAASITQTTAKDLASQLADTIADTFADGFDSSKVGGAIEKVVQQTMQNAVKNALKKQYLETYLQPVIDDLQKAMGFDSLGNGSFDGLTDAEQKQIQDRIAQIAGNYAEAMKMYEDLFKGFEDDSDPSTSLSGAIKGASQESIDLLAGQTNAVRVNQVVSIDILRQQLIHIASIDNKVSISNQLLSQIYDSVSSISSDPLRAQGITL